MAEILSIDLTDEQKYFYRQNGFLSIPRITTDEEIDWLKTIYDKLFLDRTGEEEGFFYDLAGPRGHDGRDKRPQVLGPDITMPTLRESISYKNAKRLSSQLLAIDQEVHVGGHMIYKPAKYGAETPWHQDEAYWDPEVFSNGLSVWTVSYTHLTLPTTPYV